MLDASVGSSTQHAGQALLGPDTYQPQPLPSLSEPSSAGDALFLPSAAPAPLKRLNLKMGPFDGEASEPTKTTTSTTGESREDRTTGAPRVAQLFAPPLALSISLTHHSPSFVASTTHADASALGTPAPAPAPAHDEITIKKKTQVGALARWLVIAAR